LQQQIVALHPVQAYGFLKEADAKYNRRFYLGAVAGVELCLNP
jgi:hypothetical protein